MYPTALYKSKRDPSTPKATAFSAQDDRVGWFVAEATSFHLSLVNESSNSGEAVRQHQLRFIPVAEAICFH